VDTTDILEADNFFEHYRAIMSIIRGTVNVPVVLGGSGFTIFPYEIMEELEGDYGIIGEGERFSLFIEAFENHDDVSKIPGVIIRHGAVKIPEPWNGDFKRTFDGTRPHIAYYIKKGGMLNLQTKRGCAFRCIYCTYPHIEGTHLRLIPPDEVARTALKLEHAGARYFFITDSAFNCDYGHSIAVAEAFKRSGLTIPWGAFFSPTHPPDGYYETMISAGLKHVEFGTESLSDLMLRSYNKPFKVSDVFVSHERAVNAGLHVAHYLILGGPGEDPITLEETLANAMKLSKTVIFFFGGMRIYPHTELYSISVREGQIQEGQNLLTPVYYQSKLISHDKILQRINAILPERPNWVFGSGGKQIAKYIYRMHRRGSVGPLWENIIA
jgi:radical SAM superfamily enzyme YgiQ (UPF0313 family)